MSPETLEALRGSIAKWKAIVEGTGENNGTQNCPLCHMFLLDEAGKRTRLLSAECMGCPVRERTKRRYCEGSPYEEYEDIQDADGGPVKLRAAAQAELDFLISLLPEGEKP